MKLCEGKEAMAAQSSIRCSFKWLIESGSEVKEAACTCEKQERIVGKQ